MNSQKQRHSGWWSGKIIHAVLISCLVILPCRSIRAQCFSSANPVGGTTNLLVLDIHTLRTMGFFRHAYSNRYFEGSARSDFDQVKQADYNYLGWIIAWGLSQKLTLETEWGGFFNKSYHYNLEPEYVLKGSGFNNMVLSGKFRLLADYQKRLFLAGSAGIKVPLSMNPKEKDGVILPVDLQPSTNALGSVVQAFLVKENSLSGMRYFLVGRFEMNLPDRNGYRLGSALITSAFVSKHIPDHWLKGDWTVLLQMRNETRSRNKREEISEESTGGSVTLLSPQINFAITDMWNLSVMADLPLYQYFKGTQLAYNYAFTIHLSGDFHFYKTSTY